MCTARGHKWVCRMEAVEGDLCANHAKQARPKKQNPVCSFCLEEGHNRRGCYMRITSDARTQARARKTWELIRKHGSIRKASAATGIPRSTLHGRAGTARSVP